MADPGWARSEYYNIEAKIAGDRPVTYHTIYASPVRFQQRGWISAEWGVSDNNRKAKFYAITRPGKQQMKQDRTYWERLSSVVTRVLTAAGDNS